MASPMDYMVKAPEAGTDILFLQVAIGAAGAVGAIQGPGGSRMKEFRRITAANPSPVVHGTAGVYQVFLRETWLALLWGDGSCIGPTSATTGKEGDVTANAATTSPASVTFTYTRYDTGAPADPANGDIACFILLLKKFKPV